MNWIECSPEEATRATINGKVLTRRWEGPRLMWVAGCGTTQFVPHQLVTLGATFEKEAPKMSKSEAVNMQAYGQPHLMCLNGVHAFIVNDTGKAVNVTVSARIL